MVPPSTLTALPELQEKVTGRAVPYPTRSRCRRTPPHRNQNHHENHAHQQRRNHANDAHPERRLTLPHSGSVFPQLKDELTGYSTSSGALRFSIDQPLPVPLVEKLGSPYLT